MSCTGGKCRSSLASALPSRPSALSSPATYIISCFSLHTYQPWTSLSLARPSKLICRGSSSESRCVVCLCYIDALILIPPQMQDFMRMYSNLVERCFTSCCNDFTSKALSSKEVSAGSPNEAKPYSCRIFVGAMCYELRGQIPQTLRTSRGALCGAERGYVPHTNPCWHLNADRASRNDGFSAEQIEHTRMGFCIPFTANHNTPLHVALAPL